MVTLDGDEQLSGNVLLIRPKQFCFNPQTADSNVFQARTAVASADVQAQAMQEFDAMLSILRDAGVCVVVIDDSDAADTPDAIFPNNWVSFHSDGTVILYPMEAPNRRLERRIDIIESLSVDFGYHVRDILDLSSLEDSGLYLEGTGSMVLDRINREVYAALSSRTHMDALADFARQTGYSLTVFDATGPGDIPVYHTNVMMSIGDKFVVICADAVADSGKRKDVLAHLARTGRRIIEITTAQMESFAGNILQLRTGADTSAIVLSRTAHDSLSRTQLNALEQCGRVLPVDVGTIERVGGGSVRCMMAEIFLPRTMRPDGR
jgi:hypothetical protein